MDSTALSLCMDNHLPINVFNMNDERNIDRIVSGERVGTLVKTGMIDELLQDAREHMDKSVDATRHKFGSVRTGRASTASARPHQRSTTTARRRRSSSSPPSRRPRRGC